MSKSQPMQNQTATSTTTPPSTSTLPTSPPTTPITRAQQMLLDFLREHDADPPINPVPPDCPVCGYSLKSLTKPICPECGQELALTVSAMRLHLGWLLAALAPGFFSGIAAVFLAIPIVISTYHNDPPPLLIFALDLFGWCSGVFALLLAFRWRIAFLTQPRARQRWIAIIIWFIHIAALGTFIGLARMFL